MVKTIRGISFSTRVSVQFENTMIHAVRGIFVSMEVPDDVYKSLDAAGEGENWWEASNNCLTSFPEDLSNCLKMSKLDVEGNKLTVLSERLVASWTLLTESEAVSKLIIDSVGLLFLILQQKNALSGIPESIGCLSRLIRLDLQSEQAALSWQSSIRGMTSLPTEIRELTTLGTFDLHSNKLKEYSVDACKLKLSVLYFSNNSLSRLPAEIGKIPSNGFQVSSKLQILDLSNNAGSLPEYPAFSCLLQLQELYLRRMQISEVRADILSLPKLRILDMSKNSLQSIPVGFKDAKSLQELRLSDNNISTLPNLVSL
ncbi:plant intracellular Ras-group-related LRR protein 6 isoform X2 [Tanacetum coccineum]|uniref:Plant intracellular Ras-group-related LRR protein 6 isoform X2 n=1 Tax=Tanacetum coccineum TaxID=301880 RepID=A0ABQ4XTH9_9ASTR